MWLIGSPDDVASSSLIMSVMSRLQSLALSANDSLTCVRLFLRRQSPWFVAQSVVLIPPRFRWQPVPASIWERPLHLLRETFFAISRLVGDGVHTCGKALPAVRRPLFRASP